VAQELSRNLIRASELSDSDVAEAIDRIRARDERRGDEAEHVVEALTWGEGLGVLRQAGLQSWLWYVVPTKYFDGEDGYMGGLAETAGVLFDELGLHGYAAICRSEQTGIVHAAFDRSDSAGRTALRKAIGQSGIEPPDLDDFAWSTVMWTAESQAQNAVEDALEDALFDGRMKVGASGWRKVQRKVCAEVLDADHPDIPGQSWRTAIVTERIQQWVSSADRSPALAEARAAIANLLLHPIDPPATAASAVEPVQWLLHQWGNEQPITEAGYLKPAFVQSLQADRPWAHPFGRDVTVKKELDDVVLHNLRGWLQGIGALRKHKATLRRTPLGRAMAADVAHTWTGVADNMAGDGWPGFVAETALLFLLRDEGQVQRDAVPVFVRNCATAMGWQTTSDGVPAPASIRDVSWTFADASRHWEPCGLLEPDDDWRSRSIGLTDAGRGAALSYLRHVAAGPKHSPA